jgi:hypothetical protein
MSFFFSQSPNLRLKIAVFACGLLLLSLQVYAESGSESPFLGLSGYWSGSGTVTMTNGAAERIRCRSSYAVNATGRTVQQTLRCASDSYRLEISSNVMFEGGSLSGSWTEANRGISGSISGRASSSEILANATGAGFAARIDIRTHGDKQSVAIRPQGDKDVAAVSIVLRKG